MGEMKTFNGSCHCQAVKFEIDTDIPELTTCNCSICFRNNALMIKVHESSMHICLVVIHWLNTNFIQILLNIIFVKIAVFIRIIENELRLTFMV